MHRIKIHLPDVVQHVTSHLLVELSVYLKVLQNSALHDGTFVLSRHGKTRTY
jgi:hypothetical protein